MKDGFKGFYNPGGEDIKGIWNSKETIFVFDTNVYLNIYSYAEKTKDDLFSVLDRIKSNLWVPNHVALEYQKRRLDVMDKERENFTKINNVFKKFNTQINVEIIQTLGIEKKMPALHDSLSDFLIKFNELTDVFLKGVFEEQRKLKPDVRSSDDIRKRLDSILSGKIGKPFNQEELNSIYEEGEVRFANKIPPGFRDAGKGGDSSDFNYLGVDYKRKFGDLIIWKQLINESLKNEINNVIFITDDKKNDWWYSVGDKTIGPQERLQSEFYMATGVDSFKMYDTVDFLKDAVICLGTEVDEKSFDDVKKATSSVAMEVLKSSAAGSVSDYDLKYPDKSYYSVGYNDSYEKGSEDKAATNSLNLESLEREENLRRAGLVMESYREREEAARRFGLESIRDWEEKIRRASLGMESYRELDEIRRRRDFESLREYEEKIRRSNIAMEGLAGYEELSRRGLDKYREHNDRNEEGRFSTSDDFDEKNKENHRKLSKREPEDKHLKNTEEGDE